MQLALDGERSVLWEGVTGVCGRLLYLSYALKGRRLGDPLSKVRTLSFPPFSLSAGASF